MKRILAFLFLLAIPISSALTATYCYPSQNYSFYLQVGSGVSFSQPAHVVAPLPTWTPAIQGYDAKLGSRGIAALSVGCQFMRLMDLEVGVSTRSIFKYRKFQTPVDGGQSYKREFDLDVTPILFSVNLLGREFSCLNWNIACGKLYPLIGAGVGVSNLLITNFRTIELPPFGASAPFASFSAENTYTRHQKLTYTALAGFEYNYNDRFAITTGYRWLDAGTFKGPRFQRVATGAAVDIAGKEWKMRFRANEWFIELKIFL